MKKFRIIKESDYNRHDFNKENDDTSKAIKDRAVNGPLSLEEPKPLVPVPQPGDKVVFNGKAAQVLSSWPNGDVIIMQGGMTIECTVRQLTVVGKVDNYEVPFKHKGGLPVNETLAVRLVGDSAPMGFLGEAFVSSAEYFRKKGKQNVRVVKESGEELAVPKDDIELLPPAEGGEDYTKDYVHAVIVGSAGQAERKCLVHGVAYAEAEGDDVMVPVMFYAADGGFKHGQVPKRIVRTLSV